MTRYELAQLNVARLRAPLDSPMLADFVGALGRINALADGAPGFVWRLQDDAGDATSFRPAGEDVLVNMSVWKDAESLNAFVYRSDHAGVMRRRREWFERMDLYLVLWWVPQGHRPTVEEALERLEHLRAHGPTPQAFSMGKLFPAPDAPPASEVSSLDDACPAT